MRALLLAWVAIASMPSAALAEGVNLAWGPACWTEGNQNRLTTFACDTNGSAGDRTISLSWVVDTFIPDLVAVEWEIHGYSLVAAGYYGGRWGWGMGPLPDYWKLGAPPDCRAGKAVFNSNYTASETAAGLCVDWTAGAGLIAPSYTWSDDQVRITLVTAVEPSHLYAAQAGQEYYGGGVTFVNSSAAGVGRCEGCSCKMAFWLKSLWAVGMSGYRDTISQPLGNSYLEWNDASSCSATPARGTTWGQVKGLYR